MKVAVITGAASGIGLALTEVCLHRGVHVVMVDKDLDRLVQKAEWLRTQFPNQVTVMTCDVTQAQEVEQLAQNIMRQLGRIDWIYNNAGIIGHLAPIWELTAEQIHQVMDVNVYGMVHIIRAFSSWLFKQDFYSHIINMASLYALCSGSQLASYSMSKHAVLSLSESLHYDVQQMEKPVHVSVVFPSFTDTALLETRTEENNSVFHDSLNSLLAHSRPALDVALHIVHEVEQKRFYILPDKEVKGYCEERTQAIIAQENPHINNIEKIMNALVKRKRKSKS